MQPETVVEILSYQLRAEMRDQFHRVMMEASLPLHKQAGIDVVACGPVLGDENGYILIRRFASIEAVEPKLADFYASGAWQHGPRQKIIKAIISTERKLISQHLLRWQFT